VTFIDHVAVERACEGDTRVNLTDAETAESFRRLEARGMGVASIAEVLGVTHRTVSRWRAGAIPQAREAVR
jgi:transposase-like protein